MTPMERPPRQRRRGRGDSRPNGSLPRFDQDLRQAKNQKLLVRFHMATEFSFTDEEGVVGGIILEADKYAVKIESPRLDEEPLVIWLQKAWIGGTEIDQ